MSKKKTVFCRIDGEYREICNNPWECAYGEECMKFGEVKDGKSIKTKLQDSCRKLLRRR